MGSRRSGSEIEDQAEVKDVGDPLASFYSGLKRVDEKETTLTLLPSTIQYYFSTVLRDGLLTKEGKEEMHDKYFVGPNQFAKFYFNFNFNFKFFISDLVIDPRIPSQLGGQVDFAI